MTPGQEDPRRRPGARLPVLLFSLIVAGVAGSLLWASWTGDDARVSGTVGGTAATAAPGDVAGLTSPVTAAEVSPAAAPPPSIGVRLPPPPAAPDPTPASTGAGDTSAARAWSAADWSAYCSSPATPTGASSARGLLDAANTERARLGIAPLAWSDALAAAARDWSGSMARSDEAVAGMADALAHSPTLPGRAQNVGVTASSGGVSESQAAATLARGWMRSSGHCRNIMNPAYTVMGAGLAATSDGTTWYGTENFG